jgi:hypothetical protein
LLVGAYGATVNRPKRIIGTLLNLPIALFGHRILPLAAFYAIYARKGT